MRGKTGTMAMRRMATADKMCVRETSSKSHSDRADRRNIPGGLLSNKSMYGISPLRIPLPIAQYAGLSQVYGPCISYHILTDRSIVKRRAAVQRTASAAIKNPRSNFFGRRQIRNVDICLQRSIKYTCYVLHQCMNTDSARAYWNDEMYAKHPTPYGDNIAGRISSARVRAVERLARIRPDDTVLEIGCEAGHLITHLPLCKRLVGGDISVRALKDAQCLSAEKHRSIEFLHMDAEKPLPFLPGAFSVIILSEIMEHVHEPRLVLQHVYAISTSETRVIITVPIERPKIVIKKILSMLGLLPIFFPGIEPGQSEWHVQVFSKRFLMAIMHGLFTIVQCRNVFGCHYATLLRKKECPGNTTFITPPCIDS